MRVQAARETAKNWLTCCSKGAIAWDISFYESHGSSRLPHRFPISHRRGDKVDAQWIQPLRTRPRRPASNCAFRVAVPTAQRIDSASRGQHLTMPGNFAPFESKMRADGLSDAAVAAFKNAYDALTSGG